MPSTFSLFLYEETVLGTFSRREYQGLNDATVGQWVSGEIWSAKTMSTGRVPTVTAGNPIYDKRMAICATPAERTLAANGDNANGFLCADHLAPLLKFINKKTMYLSVRDTGALSLARIRAGHACKGHDILDKSLKAKSIDSEKATLDRINVTAISGIKYAVAVGHSNKLHEQVTWAGTGDYSTISKAGSFPFTQSFDCTGNAVLSQQAFLELKRRVKNIEDRTLVSPVGGKTAWEICKGLVGWWASVKVSLSTGEGISFKVPVGVLCIGETVKLPGTTDSFGRSRKGETYILQYPNGQPYEFQAAFEKGFAPNDSFTGDYDLHDIDYGKFLGDEEDFRTVINEYETLNRSATKAAMSRYYKLIQHGAQSEYQRYISRLESSHKLMSNEVLGLSEITGEVSSSSTPGGFHGEQDSFTRAIKMQRERELGAAAAAAIAAMDEREQVEESLFNMDRGGVVALAPGNKIYVLFGQGEIAQYFEDNNLTAKMGKWGVETGQAVWLYDFRLPRTVKNRLGLLQGVFGGDRRGWFMTCLSNGLISTKGITNATDIQTEVPRVPYFNQGNFDATAINQLTRVDKIKLKRSVLSDEYKAVWAADRTAPINFNASGYLGRVTLRMPASPANLQIAERLHGRSVTGPGITGAAKVRRVSLDDQIIVTLDAKMTVENSNAAFIANFTPLTFNGSTVAGAATLSVAVSTTGTQDTAAWLSGYVTGPGIAGVVQVTSINTSNDPIVLTLSKNATTTATGTFTVDLGTPLFFMMSPTTAPADEAELWKDHGYIIEIVD